MIPFANPAKLAALTFAALLGQSSQAAQDAQGTPPPRPTLQVFENAAAVDTWCAAGLRQAEQEIATLSAAPIDDAFRQNALGRWNRMEMLMEDSLGPVGIASATAPDKPVREAAEACELKFSKLRTAMLQNSALYERMRAATTPGPADLETRAVILESFEDGGAALPPTQRARAKEILDRLDTLGIEFQRNTRENLGTIAFSATELEGMPASYLAAHPADDKGVIALGMNYPDFVPFLENAVSGEARRRYYMAFNRIGGERNIAILDEAAKLRLEFAKLFGKSSFAEHIIARRMAKTPAKVTAFLDSVRDKVLEVEKRDLDILRAAKADFLGRPLAEVKLERWDTAFYTERVRRAKYAVDQNALRKYFPTEASVAWLTDLAQRLYGVRFVAAQVPTWHADVRYYDIFDATGQRIAGAYFDLYPREGKYNHAAVWPVRGASTRESRTPISVMVANLDRKGLDHGELETLLHEFGHMLHGTLSRTEYSVLSGTGVRRDFVEAPSQMLEEWARNAESLALIRNHCQDCPAIDPELLKRLNQARRFGAGIHYSRQHVLASFDMAMAGAQPGEPLATYRALEEATPLGHTPGTMFPARFGHLLGGYAAGYYGYMWSEVIALDMAAQWRGKLLDRKISQRYLDTVLARGGETPPDQLVRTFLGREPSPAPFFAQITGSRGND